MAIQVAGTNIQIDLTLQDDAGDPQDLEGATLFWRLTRAYSVPGVLDKDTTGVTVAVVSAPGTDGLAVVNINAIASQDLQGTYYHEIKADYGSDQEKTWQLDTITFNESSVGGD